MREAPLDDPALQAMAGEGRGELGRGGMRTKLVAAIWAARSGASTVIAPGAEDAVLTRLMGGESIGTWLQPVNEPMTARKRWIAGQHQLRGELVLDDGAVQVLLERGKSLLPVGVTAIRGRFQRGDLVACVDAQGEEIARGLSNYSSVDARRLVGKTSDQITEVLGRPGDTELIHRDNLVIDCDS